MTRTYKLTIDHIPDDISDSDIESAITQGLMIMFIRKNYKGIADKIKANAVELK